MANAPIVESTPGLYQELTTANTDYPVAIVPGAKSLILWFEASATDATVISGRVAFDKDDDVITGITGTDTVLGYHPPVPIEYSLAIVGTYDIGRRRATHLHLASSTAGAVVRGMWLTNS